MYTARRTYGTRYSSLSQNELLCLFGTKSWDALSFEERRDACQEVENRYAQANGCQPCKVETAEMTGSCYGYQSGGTLTLNESLLCDGVFMTEDFDDEGNGVLATTEVPAPNWNMLDTVYHEGTHGIQAAQGRMPFSYFDPVRDYDLYRIQPIEKEAFEAGQDYTLQAIDIVQEEMGEVDPSAIDYYCTVQQQSYQQSFDSAADHYQDPDIDKTVESAIQWHDMGMRPQNPTPSMEAVYGMLDGPEEQLQQSSFDDDSTLSQQSLSEQELDDGASLSFGGAIATSGVDDGADISSADISSLDSPVEGQNVDDGYSF